MPIFKALTERAGLALERAGRVRDRYLVLYSRALEAGTARLDDFLKGADAFSPPLRDLLEGRVERLQHHLDDLNQSLAERAVPVDRKARVGRLSLDTKARKAGQPGLRVVAGTARVQPGEAPTAPTGPRSESAPKNPTQREAGAKAHAGKRKSANQAGAAEAAKGNGRAKAAPASGAKTSPKKSSGKTSSNRKLSNRKSSDRTSTGSARSRKPAPPDH